MRTLELNEIEQVAGGLLPVALVPLIKAAAPVVATVVTAVVAASVVRDALEEAAKLCSEGADVTVKSPVVELSCSAKKDGQGYTAVHHLIPLGQGGADSPSNMVVLSAQMHRMMHYADVSAIDLTKMKKTMDGGRTLEIKINGEDFTMRWNPAHGKVVSESQ
jgi:hypothetical protein